MPSNVTMQTMILMFGIASALTLLLRSDAELASRAGRFSVVEYDLDNFFAFDGLAFFIFQRGDDLFGMCIDHFAGG